MRDFVVTLQPVWWVLRAWVAFALVGTIIGARPVDLLPDSATGWLVLVGFVVLSVQLGRETTSHLPWLRWAVLGGNVAAIALLPGVLTQVSDMRWDYETAVSSSAEVGLYLDNEPVSNLFPYDADGQPLTGVQLFDASGRPVAVGQRVEWVGDRSRALVPYRDVNGRLQWNAFPLHVAREDPVRGGAKPGTVRAAVPPFPVAPAVRPPAVDGPEPTSAPTPSSTPVPTAMPTTTTPLPSAPTPGGATP